MSNQKTHDYSNGCWGHDCHITSIEDDGLTISLTGWGFGLSNNDYIVLKNGSDTTRYKLDDVEYTSNPPDMWFAKASFSPREH